MQKANFTSHFSPPVFSQETWEATSAVPAKPLLFCKQGTRDLIPCVPSRTETSAQLSWTDGITLSQGWAWRALRFPIPLLGACSVRSSRSNPRCALQSVCVEIWLLVWTSLNYGLLTVCNTDAQASLKKCGTGGLLPLLLMAKLPILQVLIPTSPYPKLCKSLPVFLQVLLS